MTVTTNATDMVRIVNRAGRPGLLVQHWDRHPDSTSWICRHETTRLTLRGALRQAKRWPGPLTIEPHYRTEIPATTPPAITPGARTVPDLPGRFYGDGGTIHGTSHVDVETDRHGAVVAVWFRCSPLPFEQTRVDDARADSMRTDDPPTPLAGVVFRDEEPVK